LVPGLVQSPARGSNPAENPASPSTGKPDTPAGDIPPWRRLRRTVAIEAIALVAVMGITSVLVNVTPARTAFEADNRMIDQTQSVATGSVNLIVLPARVGENTLRVRYTDASGKPIDVANTLNIEFSLPSANLSAISRQTAKAGPGHFIYTGAELSIVGTWTVTLVARTSDFSEQRTNFQVAITQ
jgi:copper transport protein